jgi:hypothetical protein
MAGNETKSNMDQFRTLVIWKVMQETKEIKRYM